MGYLSVWKILDHMIADFKKRDTSIPDRIMNDLKSAKTILNTRQTQKNDTNALAQVDAHLASVESYMVSEGEKRFGKQYADEWLMRIDEASRRVSDEEEKQERFVSGLPREHKWIRVKPSDDLPKEKLEALARESGLSCKTQSDDFLLVYGTNEQIRNFVKKMTTKHHSKPKK